MFWSLWLYPSLLHFSIWICFFEAAASTRLILSGRCCPFSGQPTPALFFLIRPLWQILKLPHRKDTQSNYPLALPGCMWVFSPYPPWRPSHSALPAAQELMWMRPEQAKMIQVPLGSPQTVNGMHVPMVCMDASPPKSLNPHRQQQVPVGTKSFSALSESEGRFIPRRSKMSFLIVDAKVSASSKASASNSTLRKPKVRYISTNHWLIPCTLHVLTNIVPLACWPGWGSPLECFLTGYIYVFGGNKMYEQQAEPSLQLKLRLKQCIVAVVQLLRPVGLLETPQTAARCRGSCVLHCLLGFAHIHVLWVGDAT